MYIFLRIIFFILIKNEPEGAMHFTGQYSMMPCTIFGFYIHQM